MKKNSLLMLCIMLITIASCAMITPAPDFVIDDYDPIGYYVDITTVSVPVLTVVMTNISSVDAYLTRIEMEYLHNDSRLYYWGGNNNDLRLSFPGAEWVNGEMTDKSTLTLYNYEFPFPTEVYDEMDKYQWSEVNMRVYITIEDITYGKETTKYFDYHIMKID
ncbi:hypothetical protein KAU15_01065 [candidate division WOR-3 bacterium]|nr:hypothetical protein [candidate division WOR-3 bacterium]